MYMAIHPPRRSRRTQWTVCTEHGASCTRRPRPSTASVSACRVAATGNLRRATFVLFLSHARLLRRAVEWIRAEPSSSTGSPQESGTAELAAATVSSILEVADVVVTADGCHTAVGGLHLQETVDGARRSRVGADTPPSNPSEFVLEAVNCLRPCLRDASVSSADEADEAAAAGVSRRRSRSRSRSWSRSPRASTTSGGARATWPRRLRVARRGVGRFGLDDHPLSSVV